jgi:hypothetical protein
VAGGRARPGQARDHDYTITDLRDLLNILGQP